MQIVAAAANLRARVFSIRQSSELEVQRIAGNIIPALATTTSLVAGLVSLEVVKIAAERVRARRLRETEQFEGQVDESSTKGAKLSLMRRLFGRRVVRPAISALRAVTATTGDRERRRLLSRFHNSFVNLATPMLAFSEPVEAEAYSVQTSGGEKRFTAWDHIEVTMLSVYSELRS